jgi:CRP/FNR family transcriptional regulator, anaerobic regulatory protein
LTRLEVLPVSGAAKDDWATTTLPSRCSSCAVRDTALCASMSDDELVALSAIGRRRTIAPGQVVRWAGDEANLCASIVRGTLKVTATMADGREQIVGLLFPGDFVGQLFSVESDFTVTAIVEADLCSYPRRAFEALLDEFPRLERMLLKRTLASLNEARERMLALGRKTALERVVGFIQSLVERLGQRHRDGTVHVTIPVSRGEMADYLGLTIETVSRQLTRLRTASIIAFVGGNRDCQILDPEQLEDMVISA